MNRVCNVGRNCHKSNLRVKPEKGKAILWYSHLIDEKTGWLGQSDPYSFHGGCDVIKGTKWIANNWITVSENRTKDIEFWIREEHISRDPGNFIDKMMSAEDVDDKVLEDVKQDAVLREEKIDSIFDAVLESSGGRDDESVSSVSEERQRNEL